MAFPQLTKDSMRDPSVSTLGREANEHSLLELHPDASMVAPVVQETGTRRA